MKRRRQQKAILPTKAATKASSPRSRESSTNISADIKSVKIVCKNYEDKAAKRRRRARTSKESCDEMNTTLCKNNKTNTNGLNEVWNTSTSTNHRSLQNLPPNFVKNRPSRDKQKGKLAAQSPLFWVQLLYLKHSLAKSARLCEFDGIIIINNNAFHDITVCIIVSRSARWKEDSL